MNVFMLSCATDQIRSVHEQENEKKLGLHVSNLLTTVEEQSSILGEMEKDVKDPFLAECVRDIAYKLKMEHAYLKEFLQICQK